MLFSEPKIPQFEYNIVVAVPDNRFSALQRAENSSIDRQQPPPAQSPAFQCSSASRKFLNRLVRKAVGDQADVSVLFSEPKIPQSLLNNQKPRRCRRFSALQRAENSSIAAYSVDQRRAQRVSVLFSEPKIPQCPGGGKRRRFFYRVSVLFSEPKIPQCNELQSISFFNILFQCSSASRKFLNPDPRTCVHPYFRPR